MNTKIDWRRKLSSRKFWAAVAAWLSANGAAFGMSANVLARAICVVGGIGALCVYMLAEAITDGANTADASIMPTGEAFADALAEMISDRLPESSAAQLSNGEL